MPWARPAARALARVQPVPWVWRVAMRGLSKRVVPVALTSRSDDATSRLASAALLRLTA
jgi:hypothetical protein